ncbi:MAG: tetratricopeptide repeat protein [Alphaproteobacteria bacterium]
MAIVRPLSAMLLSAAALVGGCAASGPGAAPTSNLSAGPAASPLGSYLAGRSASLNGDTEAAAAYYDHALAADPDNQLLRLRAFSMQMAEGNWDRALPLAKLIDKQPATSFTADLLLATDAARRGDFEAARDHLQSDDTGNAGALMRPLLLAWVGVGLNDAALTDQALGTLGQRESLAAFRSFHAALIEDLRGNPEAAAKAFEETRASAAGNATRVVTAYASFLARRGETDKVKAMLEEYLSRFPDNPGIESALGELEQTGTIVPMITSIGDGIAEAYYGAAGVLAQDRTADAARIYARLALFMRPDFDNGTILLGEILERDDRYADANRAYGTVAEASPYRLDARLRIASNLNRMDRVDEAIAELRAATASPDTDASALVTLADLLRGRERFTEAVTVYDQAVAKVGTIEARHWALLYARGIALERDKQWQRAEADFLKALELRPDQPLVMNYLGYSWVEQGRNLDRARDMIERAVAQRPNDGYIVDSLGWALFHLGDFEGAVKQLERAVSLRPEDPVINDHLGDAYWRVGRRLEARFKWRHALSLKPEAAAIPAIETKLESGLGPVSGDRDG